ncbi:hypothetical protein P154DRAFT_624889 [Amniculicola lignicola CBS 123094]|uniref:Uncharacterized protein n=1 Tax=Amniculicola lignicola CBS 123094 TaxID=1392246 RepID=A0A6A5VXS7_9PLEO|nr:hypothetical protein P154DRAFT_624889 [Amniculicola lignicola CBS 123094]
MPIDFDEVTRRYKERLATAMPENPWRSETKHQVEAQSGSTVVRDEVDINLEHLLDDSNIAPTKKGENSGEALSNLVPQDICAAVHESLPRELRDLIYEALCFGQTASVQAPSLRSEGYFENTHDFHWCYPQYSGYPFAREAVETYYKTVEFSLFVWDFDLHERFMGNDKFGIKDIRPAEFIRHIVLLSQSRFSIVTLRNELQGYISTTLTYLSRTINKACHIQLFVELPDKRFRSKLRLQFYDFVAPELLFMLIRGFRTGIRWDDGFEFWMEPVTEEGVEGYLEKQRKRLIDTAISLRNHGLSRGEVEVWPTMNGLR